VILSTSSNIVLLEEKSGSVIRFLGKSNVFKAE